MEIDLSKIIGALTLLIALMYGRKIRWLIYKMINNFRADEKKKIIKRANFPK
jgi:hypothetical protein